ncbi:MAG TPA: FG-GAP repeat protein, partial [Planctomycetota bacterium]|nr:FG-GAP repeat protein [Planctomycetota bacterium]
MPKPLLWVFISLCLLASLVGGQVPVFLQYGAATGTELGRNLLALDDLDGDGVPEWAAASPHGEGLAGFYCGFVEVRSGRTGGLLWRIEGDVQNGRLGTALGLADVTGDGLPEILIGQPKRDGPAGHRAGRVLVVSQVSGTLLYAVDGPVPYGEFGHRVIGLDDRNNDGRAEFAASSPWAKIPGVGPAAGRVDILDGASGLTAAALQGTQKFSLFGAALSALPDQSGDGLMELLIGSPRFDLPGLEDAGRLEIETGTGFTWAERNGEAAGELYGSDAIWPGDLDGDGIADLVVSAPMAPGTAGLRAGRIQALSGPLYDTVIWNREGSEANAAFGTRLEPLDDQNTNQFPDFLVHSPLRNGNALTNSGSVQLIEGQTGTTIWDIEGSQPGGRLGTGMAGGR